MNCKLWTVCGRTIHFHVLSRSKQLEFFIKLFFHAWLLSTTVLNRFSYKSPHLVTIRMGQRGKILLWQLSLAKYHLERISFMSKECLATQKAQRGQGHERLGLHNLWQSKEITISETTISKSQTLLLFRGIVLLKQENLITMSKLWKSEHYPKRALPFTVWELQD